MKAPLTASRCPTSKPSTMSAATPSEGGFDSSFNAGLERDAAPERVPLPEPSISVKAPRRKSGSETRQSKNFSTTATLLHQRISLRIPAKSPTRPIPRVICDTIAASRPLSPGPKQNVLRVRPLSLQCLLFYSVSGNNYPMRKPSQESVHNRLRTGRNPL